MRRFVEQRSRKVGLPPGALVHLGERKAATTTIRVMDYDASHLREAEISSVDECAALRDSPSVTWINVDGVHDVEVMDALGKSLRLHPLVVEDILNTDQRPKTEDFGDYLYIVLKMFNYHEKSDEINAEQISLILGPRFVASFQEQEGDVFNPIRERIRQDKGRIRKTGADYLAYALIDAVVDNYFFILEKIGESLEDVEERLINNPTTKTLQSIHHLKREMIFLRKCVWPLREVVGGLERGEYALIKEPTRIYLRDVYDHTVHIIDTMETFREMLSGMLDIYLSSLSHRMNEVMKVLTIIATLFIPPTLIAGIYGMNFKYMPELGWRWGYPIVLTAILAIIVGLLIFFRKRRWIWATGPGPVVESRTRRRGKG